ncbi:hypothetical protein [Aureibacillus halotolerans]|uniref:Tail assembly chaperone n=1 Tax=Aureibacillus halotolerans TaxID=1508390 RepID=A0A4R6U006_9BACI|nr:hypothetical protein [Aureibacillus halotolerans]TDQ39241.1 hypothetical protein EV213_108193 [Aureibacillus halotolerans]
MAKNDVRIKRVPIELDKTRHLVFDMNAFCELEDEYGDFQEAMNKISSGSIKATRAMLWAALIHEDETLTPKKVGAMIAPNQLEGIVTKITDAITAALPEADESDTKNK